MNRMNTLRSMDTLVRVRTAQVERCEADLARQQAASARYRHNLARLDDLAQGSGASGTALPHSPVLALNCGAYKQDVLALAAGHRADLALHDATMAVTRTRLQDAWVRRELLGKVLARERDAQAIEHGRAARKRDDDIATQAWMAGSQ